MRPGLRQRRPGGLPRRPRPDPAGLRHGHHPLPADRVRPDGRRRNRPADPAQPPRVPRRHRQPRRRRRRTPWTGSSGSTATPTSRGWNGGTYLVARRIRIHLEAWDRSTLEDQEQTIGRVKTSGAPLGGINQSDPVDLQAAGADGQPAHPRQRPHPGGRADAPTTARPSSGAATASPTASTPNRASWMPGSSSSASRRTRAGSSSPSRPDCPTTTPWPSTCVHTGSGIFACPPGVVGGRSFGDPLLRSETITDR